MFRIICEQTTLNGAISFGNSVTETNNIRDISDILLNLDFSEDDAKRIESIAGYMKHEDIFENRNLVMLCYDEEKSERKIIC